MRPRYRHPFLTFAEVAAVLKVSEEDVEHMVSIEDPVLGLAVSPVSPGEVPVIHAGEVHRFINARAVRSDGPDDPRLADLRRQWDEESPGWDRE